jgi:uncharacterized protein YbjQ (UPF0145 family)
MPFCSKCGSELPENVKFCPKCGAPTKPEASKPGIPSFIIVTTPTIPGYRITRVLGVVVGLTPRTRGVGGKFVAGIQSMVGGEVTAFTSELEKTQVEALDRVKQKALELGANAIIGVNFETTEVFQSTVMISVTGTAVIVEPESG